MVSLSGEGAHLFSWEARLAKSAEGEVCYNRGMTLSSSPESEPRPAEAVSAPEAATRRQRLIVATGVLAGVLLLAGVVAAVVALLQPDTPTERIRDIFIIFMAFESLIIGVALIVLIIQIAALINLLQNEVRPILEATNETVYTLRGTTTFLSENLVQPVVKLNASLAALRRALELLGLLRR